MARPLSKAWQETNQAAATLGLKPRQLRSLRECLKAGEHYRVLNPKAAKHRYIWHVERVASELAPQARVNG
jgi:hypothetical protein